ncbi:hypothetical protein HDU98_007910 [Podochytrium sp. JEL0797]|nr:hypothetical protein HDU98_007910 [Podochytrium sp. JEL0797]
MCGTDSTLLDTASSDKTVEIMLPIGDLDEIPSRAYQFLTQNPILTSAMTELNAMGNSVDATQVLELSQPLTSSVGLLVNRTLANEELIGAFNFIDDTLFIKEFAIARR